MARIRTLRINTYIHTQSLHELHRGFCTLVLFNAMTYFAYSSVIIKGIVAKEFFHCKTRKQLADSIITIEYRPNKNRSLSF